MERFPVSRYHRDAAPHPERPVFPARGILDDDNGFFELGLDDLSGFSWSFMTSLPDGQLQASSMAISRSSGLSDCSVRFQIPPARIQNRAWTQRFS